MISSFLKLISTIVFVLFPTTECQDCHAEVCEKLAKEFKIIIDNEVDPCDDFSSYVCGNFDKLHPLPPGYCQFSIIDKIEIEIFNELKTLLEKQSMSNENDAKSKAKIFYQSCLDMDSRNQKAKSTITQLAERMIANASYEVNLINLLRSDLDSRMIRILYSQDPKNPEYNILTIMEPNLVLSLEILQSPDSERGKNQINYYKKFMKSTLDELGMWQNERHLLDEIFLLHTNIAKAFPSLVDQHDPDKNSNRITIEDLQSRCDQISWKNLINGILKDTESIIKDNDIIMVFSLNYIDRLCSILKEYNSDSTKKRVLELDLQWAAIRSVFHLGSENLVNLTNQLSMDLDGIIGNRDLSEQCMDHTSKTLRNVIGHMYISNIFQVSKKDKLLAMKYKIGFPDFLLSEAILNEDNEHVTMVADEFMKNVINYLGNNFIQDMWNFNKKIPDDQWLADVQDVFAYYNPNEIVLPAALLRYPFYDIGLPPSVNFGGIGATIAHEIIHGFDTHGSKFDDKGFRRDWWTKSSHDEFTMKTQCLMNQYNGYSYENKTLLPNQTIDDDIADNSGTRIAYMASFSDDKINHLTLPGLNFTTKQLFFVSYALSYCSILTEKAVIKTMETDVHSLWKFRINGPVSNMPEFSDAFNCDASKKMNSPGKCLVW